MRWPRDRENSAADPLVQASITHRVAVLLQAGVAPERTWGYLAQTEEPGAAAIADCLERGMSVAAAVDAQGAAWAPLAAAWRVATEVGAPLAETLRTMAATLRDAAEAADEVRVALAEPAMTARIMLWLPVFGVLLGMLLGFDALDTFTGNIVGTMCLVLGLTLIVLARLWTRRLVAAAHAPAAAPGMQHELTAIALSGGASIPRAVALVEDVGFDADDPAVGRVLELSRIAGVPASELLRAAGAEARRHARTQARLRAARLGTQLLLPLGLCTLPAFFLLGVAPLVIAVITSTEVTW